MAAAVIQFADLAGWRAVVVEDLSIGLIERIRQNLRLRILEDLCQMFQRNAESEEFAERIPAQIAFFLELLDMLRCRTARAGFKQSAAAHQRDDRQHLRAGVQFEDRE